MFIYGLFFFMLGAALGSFSLVLAWRMHDKRDWVRGRSACDSCGHELGPIDLIPIFSWVAQGGKCRYCHKQIPKQIIGAEVLLGLVVSFSWCFWPYAMTTIAGYALFAVWIICCTILSALFWYDYRWYILPSILIYTLLGFSTLYIILKYFTIDSAGYTYILMPLLAAGLLAGFFFILHEISRGKWIGFGDVRLAIPLGILIGSPLQAWMMLFMASVLGILVTLPSLMKRSRKLTSKIPFGPLLILATFITVLFGQSIVDWYGQFIGF